jgi:hypothetical protein
LNSKPCSARKIQSTGKSIRNTGRSDLAREL